MVGAGLDRFIKKYSYFYGTAIALGLIIWTYAEPNFYHNYIRGEIFLIWTAYVFPWAVLFVIWYQFYKSKVKKR